MTVKSKWLLFGGLLLFIICGSGWMLWTQIRPWEETVLARTSWKSGGEPFIARIQVTDIHGKGVMGVRVHVDNNSGGNEEVTNDQGRVIIELGESDISGLSVNGVPVLHRPYAYHLGVPNVSKGVMVQIQLKTLSAFGLDEYDSAAE